MILMLALLIIIAVVGAIAVVACLLHEADFSELLPVYEPKKKKVGPTFWGHYEEADGTSDTMESIKLPKITFEGSAIAGSALYSKGRPVRSARK